MWKNGNYFERICPRWQVTVVDEEGSGVRETYSWMYNLC